MDHVEPEQSRTTVIDDRSPLDDQDPEADR